MGTDSDFWSGTGEPRGPENHYPASDAWSHVRDAVLEDAEVEAEAEAEAEAVAAVRKGRKPAAEETPAAE